MQNTYQFISDKGVFSLPGAADYSDLYFPVAGECGIKSAVTPTLGGDCKLDQNTFLLEPVSVENLHNNRNARNFWCHIGTHGSWSATLTQALPICLHLQNSSGSLKMPVSRLWKKGGQRKIRKILFMVSVFILQPCIFSTNSHDLSWISFSPRSR